MDYQLVTASKRKIIEIGVLVALISATLYANFKIPERDKFRLTECDGITKCEDIGLFYTRSTCEGVMKSLNADHLIFIYGCEKVE